MKLYVLTYGIACIEEKDGKRELVTEIPSVTSSLAKAARIVKLCNEEEISPTHLKDVVEDLISAV